MKWGYCIKEDTTKIIRQFNGKLELRLDNSNFVIDGDHVFELMHLEEINDYYNSGAASQLELTTNEAEYNNKIINEGHEANNQ